MKFLILATIILSTAAFADVTITGTKANELYTSMAKTTPMEYENENAPFIRAVGNYETGVFIECASNSVMKGVKTSCIITLTETKK